MKKILIIYATAGIGHTKAAHAVKKGFDVLGSYNAEFAQRAKEIDVKCIDSLDYTTPFFRFSYQKSYLLMIRHLSALWGALYYLTNIGALNRVVRKIRRFTNWLHCRKLVAFLKAYKPDVIISTHFLATEVISRLKQKGECDAHLVCIITDYRLHAFWVADRVDTYITGGVLAKRDLLRWNVDTAKIKTFGIPVEPEFVIGPKREKEEIRNKLNIKEDCFTVLIVGGGFGIGPIEGIIRSVDRLPQPLQVIVICGYNRALRDKVVAMSGEMRVALHVFGFVDNMYEFMEIADVLISKSGGISVTEALAKKLPMLIISPIPGQESRNCEFLVEAGAALHVRSLSALAEMLEYLIRERERLESMKDHIRKIRRHYALFNIAMYAVERAEDHETYR